MIHMATERTAAPFLADERATLTGFLDGHPTSSASA
jgi:hypothetical protein